MMARDTHPRDPSISSEPPSSTAGTRETRLTADERSAIQAAAEADGYSETFADLLCRFAELIGTDEVLGELKRLETKDQQS
jgi:hypothetical protein